MTLYTVQSLSQRPLGVNGYLRVKKDITSAFCRKGSVKRTKYQIFLSFSGQNSAMPKLKPEYLV
jgi:hypothetical protein